MPVKVYTERDVRREVEAAKAGLEHGSDWQRWVDAMRRLAGVALGGAAAEFPALLVGLVRASVHEMVGHKVGESGAAPMGFGGGGRALVSYVASRAVVLWYLQYL